MKSLVTIIKNKKQHRALLLNSSENALNKDLWCEPMLRGQQSAILIWGIFFKSLRIS